MTSQARAEDVRGAYHTRVEDRRDVSGPEGGLTHNPFAALRKPVGPQAPGQPSGTSSDKASASPASPSGPSVDPRSGRLRLTTEQAGRKGKTVTRLAGLRGQESIVREQGRALARALGCGWSVEGGDVVLQGDQVERAARWLEDGGATGVVRGK